MPMLGESNKRLEEELKRLGNGNVVNYFSPDKEKVEGVKSFYESQYGIIGPVFTKQKNDCGEVEEGHLITFSYKKKKRVEAEEAQSNA